MKKMFLLMLSAFYIQSCTNHSLLNDFERDEPKNMGKQSRSHSNAIDTYIKMARWGDVTAYMNLAKCYHDGLGVKADLLTSVAMLTLAGQHGQSNEAQAFIDSLPSNDSMKMIMNAMNHIDDKQNEQTDSMINVLIDNGCSDGYSLRGLSLISIGDTIGGVYNLQKGAEMGSAFAETLLCAMPGKGELLNKSMKIRRLSALSEQYPVINLIVGDLYAEDETLEIKDDSKAAMHYIEADKHGLLDIHQARWLLTYYDQEGIQIDDKERERLEKLAEGSHEMTIPEDDDKKGTIEIICVDSTSVIE